MLMGKKAIIASGAMMWASACAGQSQLSVPRSPPLIEGRAAEHSKVTHEHMCFDRKLGFTLISDWDSVTAEHASYHGRDFDAEQMAQFNKALAPLTEGYMTVYVECANRGGFRLSFSGVGSRSGIRQLDIYFDGKTVRESWRKPLPPPDRLRHRHN